MQFLSVPNLALTYSFEFFPPKTENADDQLTRTIYNLKSLSPLFVSITHGAMGYGRDRSPTFRWADQIQNAIGLPVACHLAAINLQKKEVQTILEFLANQNIQRIVALRGDRSQDLSFPTSDDFPYAANLVRFIRSHPTFGKTFSILVAGYPEGHQESANFDQSVDYLKEKVDEGADAIITQFFLDNALFYRFRDRLVQKGIQIPIFPGIFPMVNSAQVHRLTALCGASIPTAVRDKMNHFENRPQDWEQFSMAFMESQCRDLTQNSVSHLHFYTLNQGKIIQTLFQKLGWGSGAFHSDETPELTREM
jgi:methylenetetrahydrofolate reductase (NADPH)